MMHVVMTMTTLLFKTHTGQAEIRPRVQPRHGPGQRDLLLLHQQQARLQPRGADCPGRPGASAPSADDIEHLQQVRT